MDGMRRMPPNRSFEMKKVVVFTGAGVSADSGLSTFRDADGLWADYRIEDVCTPEALARNRRLVIEFYNKRRREMLAAPSQCGSFGHRGIGGGFRRRGHHPECRRPARTRRFDPCDASARRTAETPLLARSRVDRSDRRVGTAVGCHGPRRGAAGVRISSFSARRFPSSTMRCGLRRRPMC